MSPSYAHPSSNVQFIPDWRTHFVEDVARFQAGYCGAGGRFFAGDFVTAGGLGGTQFNAVPSFGKVMAWLARGGALLRRGWFRVMRVLLLHRLRGSVSMTCAALSRAVGRAARRVRVGCRHTHGPTAGCEADERACVESR
ncbi:MULTISPECIES: hypothetical protein [Burkholderia cepacia complex]|uniref:hypothetical protein n=1 Tax=Burkholderia cepacia complex TaxID=87882 RepID=UPI0023DDD57A|nr:MULTISPECIES: hypothetical protein [Burkholderia cepacia complex]MDF3103272.1 hypothetical protein [Burkholderia semiarida]